MDNTRKKSLLAEIWIYTAANKKLWLVPLIIFLFALGTILVAVEGSVFAPFIYSLF